MQMPPVQIRSLALIAPAILGFLVMDHFVKTLMNVYQKTLAMKMQIAQIPLEVIHAIARKDLVETGLDKMDASVCYK